MSAGCSESLSLMQQSAASFLHRFRDATARTGLVKITSELAITGYSFWPQWWPVRIDSFADALQGRTHAYRRVASTPHTTYMQQPEMSVADAARANKAAKATQPPQQ